MNDVSGNELRRKFLQFFAGKDHLILPSHSLIPEDDPTLLLIGAGMAPFKPYFTGKMKPPHARITTSQKCIRTGDIDNVGRTARHHTFFEMLGNFSFGDYFKKEAIAWGWEFITRELGIPAEQLWVTIHPTDDEAYQLWTEEVGVAPERVVKMEDNFWEIGPGPCGPCSEIYVDLGEARGCGRPDCAVGCDCDRFLEIWNLVFTQFDRDEAGNYTPLEKKNIDTGAGLERIASVLQNKKSNFETDLIFPIIEYAAGVAKVPYGAGERSDVSLKVIADHARSMTVMIGDGILPSNEGRGYVLRRLIRRAVRHGRLLGIETPFLTGAVGVVVNMFGEAYPELAEKSDFIRKVIAQEEDRFRITLEQGMELLQKEIVSLKGKGGAVLDGATAFRLYDTFGFPWELTAEILLENGLDLDKAAFDAAMEEQRSRARAARHENERVATPDLTGLDPEKLTADPAATEAEIVRIWQDGALQDRVADGAAKVGVILDRTPFYAESGGQVGDSGCLEGEIGKLQVTAVKKLANGVIYHVGTVTEGVLQVGDRVRPVVDGARKLATARNHTATHLLHAALRHVLGVHVNQAGSLVGPDRLRFDFSHFEPVTDAQLAQVEAWVNQAILRAEAVEIFETSLARAREMGAMALFGEKYGDRVRVVRIGDVSCELCGGTHVDTSSRIGVLKIVGETGVAAGVRRIEALTGDGALAWLARREAVLVQAAAALKTRPEDVAARAEALHAQVKSLEHALQALNVRLAKAEVQELFAGRREVNGVQIVSGQVSAADLDSLRLAADMLRDKLACGVVVLGAAGDGKANFVAMATDEAVAKGVHAGNVVKEAAKTAGGGGGGRPNMAQAGGRQPEKIAAALQRAYEVVVGQLGA